MPTGIANAIIYVRGIDLLSKPIQRAAAEANASLKKLYSDQKNNATKIAANNQKVIATTNSIAAAERNAAQQFKTYATRDFGLKARLKDLKDERDVLSRRQITLDQDSDAWEANLAKINKNKRARELVKKQIADLDSQIKLFQTNKDIDIGVKQDQIAKLNDASAALNRTQENLEKVELRAQKTKTSILNLQSGIANLQSKLSTLGLTLSATVTAPIVGAFTSATKSFADYESSLRNIQSIGRQTDSEMSSLSSTFLNMSKDITKTIATPKQLAESFYEVQSAGFYGADAMNILDASTRAATAGLADQQEVAKALAMALHAYGVGTEEATHYTDVMMKAVDIGIFRFEDLTSQMGDFIAAAGMMKVPIEEVMAALTAMTKKGIPIAEAATSLNRIMMNYLKPAQKEIDLAREYGIELSANTLKTKGFAGAMTEMLEKTKGNEDVLANLIGEVRGIRGVFALGSDGLKMYNADLVKMYGAAGTVTNVFNTQMKSLSAQFQNLKNNVLVLAIKFGTVLMPIISKFIQQTLIPLIQRISELPEPTKLAIAKFAGLIAITGPLMIALSSVLGVINLLIGTLAKLGAGRAIALISDAFTKLGAIAKLSTPATTAIAAIVASVAAFSIGSKMFSENTNDMVGSIERLSNKRGLLGGIAKDIKSVFTVLKEQSDIYATTHAFNKVSEDVDSFSESVRTAFEKVNEGYRLIDKSDVIGWLIKRFGHATAGVNYLGVMFKLMASLAIKAIGSIAEPIIRIITLVSDAIKSVGLLGKAFATIIKGIWTENLDFSQVNEIMNEHEALMGKIWKNIETPLDESKLGEYWDEFIAGAESAKITMNNAKAEIDALDLATPIRKSIEIDLSSEKFKSDFSWLSTEVNSTKLQPKFELGFDPNSMWGKNLSGEGIYTIDEFKKGLSEASNVASYFTEEMDKIPESIRPAAMELLFTTDVLNKLRESAESPIEVTVKLITEGFDKIDSMMLDLSKSSLSTKKIIEMQSKWQMEYAALVQSLNKKNITGLARSLELEKFWNSKQSIIDGFTNVGNAGTSAADRIKSAWGGILDNVSGKFDDAVGKANELGKNLPGVSDIWQPGANGPFEPLYRIMALADGIQGEQEQMWAGLYNVNEEQAQRISTLFKQGKYYLPEVSQYIDLKGFAEAINAENAVKEGQDKFIAEFGKQAGIPADSIASWMEGKGDNLKLATDKFAANMVTNLGTSLSGVDTAGAMIGFANNAFTSFETEFLRNASNSDLLAKTMQAATNTGWVQNGAASTQPQLYGYNIPNNGGFQAATNNISLNVNQGAIQITSDNPNEIASEIVNVIFAELSNAERRTEVPAAKGLPGGR